MASGDNAGAREEPIHAALWLPRVWFGCDPNALAIAGFASIMIVAYGLIKSNLWWIGLAIAMLMASFAFLRWLARLDSHFFRVVPRYMKYARHYSAIGSISHNDFTDRSKT